MPLFAINRIFHIQFSGIWDSSYNTL